MFTIKDLARESGYTVATVSRAINGSSLVAEKTRQKILDIAERNGYVPSAIAQNLVMQRTSTICVIVPDIVNPYFPLILRTIQGEMQKQNYATIICNTDWSEVNELNLVKLMYAQRVGGIIMDPSDEYSLRRIRNVNLHIPVVFVGNRTEDEDVGSVMVDNYNAMDQAVSYLAQLGHKKIALIGGAEKTYANRERIRGFCDAMKKRTNALDGSLLVKCTYRSGDGYRAMKTLIDAGNIPTAVVGINDSIAFGVITCLKEHGFRVPEDVSVVGFDDVELAAPLGLTTIHEPRYKMGKQAAKLLLEEINSNAAGNQGAAKAYKHIEYKTELIVRETCCPPKML